MKLEYAQAIVNAAGDEGDSCDEGNGVRLREGYSGRGMYGRTTAGVVGSRSAIMVAAMRAAYLMGAEGVDAEEFFEEVAGLSWDNMGRSDAIAY